MKHIKKFESFEINEGLGTVMLSIFVGYKLLKFILNIFVNRSRGKFMNKLKSTLKILSAAMTMHKDGMRQALSVSEFGDRYYIRSVSTLLGKIPDIRLLKNERTMIFDDHRIDLSVEEYKEFLDIIQKNL